MARKLLGSLVATSFIGLIAACSAAPTETTDSTEQRVLYDDTAPPPGHVCIPKRYCPTGDNCGFAPDGCGDVVACGVCPSSMTCGAGGVPLHCACTVSDPLAPGSCVTCDSGSSSCAFRASGSYITLASPYESDTPDPAFASCSGVYDFFETWPLTTISRTDQYGVVECPYNTSTAGAINKWVSIVDKFGDQGTYPFAAQLSMTDPHLPPAPAGSVYIQFREPDIHIIKCYAEVPCFTGPLPQPQPPPIIIFGNP